MDACDLMVPLEATRVCFVDLCAKAASKQPLASLALWYMLSLPAELASLGAAQGCSGQNQH